MSISKISLIKCKVIENFFKKYKKKIQINKNNLILRYCKIIDKFKINKKIPLLTKIQ
jgi:hypothetical protein